MADVSRLDVRLHGETIGTLTHLQGDRTLFSFTEAYAAGRSRPTLSLSFKDEFGHLITDFPATRTRVLPFFSNLLPEGQLRTYLAERAGVNPQREFFLLWVLGRDLAGALAIEPAEGEAWPPGTDERIADDARARQDTLRFSLAGVQLKFSALGGREANKGLTIPAQGVGGSWIVKLPSARFEGVPENEFAMMTLARGIGIDVPEIDLVDLDAIGNLPEGLGDLKGKAYAVARFDRTPGGPVHIEDFAQVYGVYPERKYGSASYRSIAAVIGAECAEDDIREFTRRLVFNTLIGNADLHLKNWSLIYPDRRTPALSPAYDFVATIAYIPDEEAALRYARQKRFDAFDLDELAYLAAKAHLPEKPVIDAAKDTVARFNEVWAKEKAHLPQAGRVTEAIDAHLARLPIARI
ncbi:type II toxin-antitoxin system HipA family toxin [Propylenella binzhouense]|uniref:Type II toxin-antitoxin system HipA family toxin n=1 Tax=Propylenella binzhouense TaxID=2555902 RepID=A0A964T8C4_9HYPH|nr:HipA domain-containing protein [Propylenella binzhouense]MYZ49634.1 type II toxin-antitoxin system HipA family toxin [Propylenella binzhouense]